MKILLYVFCTFLLTSAINAQVTEKNTTKMGYVLKEKDTILNEPIQLDEIVIFKEKLDPESKKAYLLLRNRVYVVYPYAKIASERLTTLSNTMAKLKTEKEKKKYFKIIDTYIENEFTDHLKKLSRKQGQILIKLINRQTGNTAYDLIKDYKSGWKAFWSNNTAKLFNINLKTTYAPYDVNEDYLIETILFTAFNSGRLVKQEAAHPVNCDELSDTWEKKAKK